MRQTRLGKGSQQERDDETGMDYMHARYYGNVQGRFSSPDPFAGSATTADPQTFNRYAYVGNNPVNATDPTGLFVEPNRNPHNANTFLGDYDDTVGSRNMDGGSGNEFLRLGQLEEVGSASFSSFDGGRTWRAKHYENY